MARRATRDLGEEAPEVSGEPPTSQSEDRERSRKLQLAEVLEHQGQIELDLDQEALARLRSVR